MKPEAFSAPPTSSADTSRYKRDQIQPIQIKRSDTFDTSPLWVPFTLVVTLRLRYNEVPGDTTTVHKADEGKNYDKISIWNKQLVNQELPCPDGHMTKPF